jgi:hypothetical protein
VDKAANHKNNKHNNHPIGALVMICKTYTRKKNWQASVGISSSIENSHSGQVMTDLVKMLINKDLLKNGVSICF